MQAVVNSIRATGATQPILLGGLNYANDLSQWSSYAPNDPLHQLAASFHNYTGQNCAIETCWNSLGALNSQVPVVTGEFGEDDCASGTDLSNFDNRYMNWADQHGISYLAWGWFVPDITQCSSLYLITDYSGTPADPNGLALQDHLLQLILPTPIVIPPPTTSTPVTSLTAPINIVSPAITGRLRVAHRLRATPGQWTGSAILSYQWQWQRCNAKARKCYLITKATRKTIKLGHKSIGHRLRVKITASNSVGEGVAFSAASGIIKK
jgi:hypothetical protein